MKRIINYQTLARLTSIAFLMVSCNNATDESIGKKTNNFVSKNDARNPSLIGKSFSNQISYGFIYKKNLYEFEVDYKDSILDLKLAGLQIPSKSRLLNRKEVSMITRKLIDINIFRIIFKPIFIFEPNDLKSDDSLIKSSDNYASRYSIPTLTDTPVSINMILPKEKLEIKIELPEEKANCRHCYGYIKYAGISQFVNGNVEYILNNDSIIGIYDKGHLIRGDISQFEINIKLFIESFNKYK